MKLLKIAVSMLFIFVLAGCGRAQPVMNVEDTPVALNLQSKQVKSAIMSRLRIEAGWFQK